jgi:hypothetical protein
VEGWVPLGLLVKMDRIINRINVTMEYVTIRIDGLRAICIPLKRHP